MPLSDLCYRRKLYALLQAPHSPNWGQDICRQLHCWGGDDGLADLQGWWEDGGKVAQSVGASSDRINLDPQPTASTTVCHPISGQTQTLDQPIPAVLEIDISAIQAETSPKTVFWWFWRFYPELLAQTKTQSLLFPAHSILPDCPLHSHQSTVSALVGALANQDAERPEDRVPYLLLFSFSPVQEFIKASRKFLDFWAGSYLLHYLSAKLCWAVAQEYGPDAVIVPSLWNQEIFDALMLEDQGFAGFEDSFRAIASASSVYKTPVERFEHRESNSLSTAGFPNMITVLVPGKAAAEDLGQKLADELVALWHDVKEKNDKGKTVVVRKGLGTKVKENIQEQVIAYLTNTETLAGKTYDQKRQTRLRRLEAEDPEALLDAERCKLLLDEAFPALSDEQREPYRQELIKLVRESNWEWGRLWDAQLSNTWEPYWAAVPLGHPDQKLLINPETENDPAWLTTQQAWADQQSEIAWPPTELPSPAEKQVYQTELNVGTWWGSLQQRLRTAHMAVKNTRHWQIPAAPGPRSSLSGQFSAVHPRLNYQTLKRHGQDKDFREGGGLPESSMRLFWLVMSYAYKGLFNGAEMLNALELTKRMAWQFGGVAQSMGINVEQEKYSKRLIQDDQEGLNIRLEISEETEIDYEKLIRFPNLSSIAAARFMHETGGAGNSRLKDYWRSLRHQVAQKFSNREHRNAFGARTRGRPTQVVKTDDRINPGSLDGHDYNGVMFSAKWLADEMNLEKARGDADKTDEVALLRQAIDAAHQDADFGDGSPSDWWVIVLGDGDGMGSYISGERLLNYGEYVVSEAVDSTAAGFDPAAFELLLNETQKRMGPATHIGLNRALLDFSNRLVPYLTEKRYCGRVIYSGGDDVMAVLPLEDLPGYVRSLRAAWAGTVDPYKQDEVGPETHDDPVLRFEAAGGYWQPIFREGQGASVLPDRPHFTMGHGATMSLGIVIANKAVPLPTVLESLWEAEQTAKAMPGKDGLCFRVIYGGGNTLEALMKGRLLDDWWALVNHGGEELSPLLYRLAEELPQRACITPDCYLFAEAAKVIVANRDESRQTPDFGRFCAALDQWLRDWEDWARGVSSDPGEGSLTGTRAEDLGYLLRFSAFWVSKNVQRQAWVQPQKQTAEVKA